MERDGSVDIMDGQETVGNSLGKAPLGWSETAWTLVDGWETMGNSMGRGGKLRRGGGETEAWTSWTDRKPREIAWGELP